jgi:hypothetical protein
MKLARAGCTVLYHRPHGKNERNDTSKQRPRSNKSANHHY